MMKEYKDSKIWCDKHEYNRIKIMEEYIKYSSSLAVIVVSQNF